jgi:lambda repressor-like predicted transcriptional regulator
MLIAGLKRGGYSMVAYSKRATFTATRPTALTGRKWVRWTKRMKADFLDHLAATCNVSASAAAIGVDPGSIYALRRHDPEFVAGWEESLRCGYQLLETQLVGHALAGEASPMITNGAPAIAPVAVDLALKLMSTRRASLQGKDNRGGPPRHRATKEETDTAILKKLAAIEKRMKAES